MKERGMDRFTVIAASVAGAVMLPGAIALGIYCGLYVWCAHC